MILRKYFPDQVLIARIKFVRIKLKNISYTIILFRLQNEKN